MKRDRVLTYFVCMMALILTLPAAHLLLELGALPASTGQEIVSKLTANPPKSVPTPFWFNAEGLSGWPGAGCGVGHSQYVTFHIRAGDYPLYRWYNFSGQSDSCGYAGVVDFTEPYGTWLTVQVETHKWLSGSIDMQFSSSNQIAHVWSYAGDANNSNNVDIDDFQILSNAYGEWGCGPDPSTYDDRADWNEDCVNDNLDFNLMRRNFGEAGDPWPPQ
jgi:hypothetical protein